MLKTIVCTETAYNKYTNKNNNKIQQTRGIRRLILRVTTLLDSSVQCLTKKNHKPYEETGKYGPLKGKINQ